MSSSGVDKVIIETNNILEDFKNHLCLPDNNRIIFSGPFGSGKSTFLKEFSEKENESFFYVKVFPVNYSVSANEDVFELIKFDLLLQIVGNYYNEIDLQKDDFTLLLKSQMFIKERMKYMPLLYAILGLADKVGSPVIKFMEALEKTVGDFKNFSEEINIDEENNIHKFLEEIQSKKGSSHEMDSISELIYELLVRIKQNKNSESVLIIDDLDRLDPEHIFRIFNIFSAHFDEIDNKNKFGFDKLIFVCDIENIRKIFEHKYGLGVDFSGYLDKFYSVRPYQFNNKRFIKDKISILFKNIHFGPSIGYYTLTLKNVFSISFSAIVLSLIDANQLNLRKLVSPTYVDISNYYYDSNRNEEMFRTSNISGNPIVVIFFILKEFYGSFELLHSKLKILNDKFGHDALKSSHVGDFRNSYEDVTNLMSLCMPIILPKTININYDGNEYKHYYSNQDCNIHYKISQRNPIEGQDIFINFIKASKSTENDSALTFELNPYEVLLTTFQSCESRGFFK